MCVVMSKVKGYQLQGKLANIWDVPSAHLKLISVIEAETSLSLIN